MMIMYRVAEENTCAAVLHAKQFLKRE